MTENGMPKVGEIWREVDPRFTRHVRIIAIESLKVIIETGYWREGRWVRVRRTKANLHRFNGKRGGYELVQKSYDGQSL